MASRAQSLVVVKEDAVHVRLSYKPLTRVTNAREESDIWPLMLVCFLWLEVSLCHLCRKGDKQPIETVVGKHVITVEGIGNSENPHPLQERMAKLHGSQ